MTSITLKNSSITLRAPVSPSAPKANTVWDLIRSQILGMKNNGYIPDSLLLKGVQYLPPEKIDTEEGEEIIEMASAKGAFAGDDGQNFLVSLMEEGKEDLVLKLVDWGVGEIDEVDEHRMTLLHHACKAGMARVVDVLLDRGAGPFVQDENGLIPYEIAEQFGHSDLAGRILLRMDPEEIVNILEVPRVIIIACTLGNRQALQELIRNHREEINHINGKGESALHILLKEQRDRLAMELIEAGADLDTPDQEGYTPLAHYAGFLPTDVPAPLAKVFADKGIDVEEISRAKFLAHVWGIYKDAVLKTSAGEDFNFALMGAAINDQMMQKFVAYAEDFITTMSDAVTSLKGVNVSKILPVLKAMQGNLSKEPEEVADDIRAKKMVAMPYSWWGHQTTILFAVINGKHVLLKCQRGEGSETPGVDIFEIGNLDNLEKVIEKLQKRNLPSEEAIAFYNKEMHDLLKLTRIGVIEQSTQDKSNCTWASLKTLFLGLLYVVCREKQADAPAQKNAVDGYKHFTPYARVKALNEYVKDAKKPIVPLLESVKEKINTTKKPIINKMKGSLLAFLEPHLPKAPEPLDDIDLDALDLDSLDLEALDSEI